MPPRQSSILPKSSRWGAALRDWRRQQNVKQLGLAEMLGVAQSTIAKWESGLDEPSPLRQRQIRALIAGTLRNESAIERLAIERQLGVRALFRLDGMRPAVLSEGFRMLWPEFSLAIGEMRADALMNESRALIEDAALMQDMHRGTVALIIGASVRHVDSPLDQAIPHRWQIALRRFNGEMFADMLFEPSPGPLPTGIHQVVRLDAFGEIDGFDVS